MTTEALPRPRTAVGVVHHDPGTRTLSVRLSEQASGYDKLLFREAWTRLRASQENGWPDGGAPWPWGNVGSARQVGHGTPADGLALSFHFPVGVPEYARLISRPGLRAIINMDSGTRLITSVTFLSGPT